MSKAAGAASVRTKHWHARQVEVQEAEHCNHAIVI